MMECKSCGATMSLFPDREYLACEYCTSIYFPKESGPDNVRFLGGASEFECPECFIQLTSGTIEGVENFICPKCNGILMTNHSFGILIQLLHPPHDQSHQPQKPLHLDDQNRLLHCPSCNAQLDSHPYYGPGNVMVDTCGTCCLIWLDRGEIGTISNA